MKGLNLHHIGIVVPDVASAAAEYRQRFGWEVCSEVIHDPRQTAFLQFLQLPGGAVFLELLSPAGPASKLANALKKGGGLNHLCYATPEIDSWCRILRDQGLFLLQAPETAVAFKGRHIAWLMGRDKIPVELVEQGPAGQL
jgi:methylmalonyl-CoA/ethylmalonyl-CoA epimerase